MRIFKSHPLLKLVNSYLIDSPQPSNLSYLWNFGSLLAFCLVIQIVTGVTLAMHYNPSVLEAFNSIEHIMRDVNNGWLIRYLHSNTASAFFFLVYLHIGRGLYYGSYRTPRTLVWVLGTVIFLLMIVTAFLGLLHSPKWNKLNKNNNNNNNNKKNINNNNKYRWISNKISNTLSKGNVRHFSTFPRSLTIESNILNNSSISYSNDIKEFLEKNNLKPVYIYENLGDMSIQSKVLNDTKNLAGVYLILNKFNLSFYVGSASTDKFYSRFRRHLFNFQGSKVVKAAVKKYKIENFAFIILDIFTEKVTKENNRQLLDMEDYYIKSLLPDYNIVTEAGNTFGYKHSEITRLKMVENFSPERRLWIGNLNRNKLFSVSHKENLKKAALILRSTKPNYSEEALANMRKKSKPLIVYNLNKTVYGEYPSIVAGAKSLRCGEKTIRRALKTPKKILRRRWIVEYISK
jgi:group I intron endonuclease